MADAAPCTSTRNGTRFPPTLLCGRYFRILGRNSYNASTDNPSPKDKLTQVGSFMKCSFISLYQEAVCQQKEDSHSANILLGTQTRTDSQEQTDQDPRNLSTQTATNTRENLDSGTSYYTQFSIIP